MSPGKECVAAGAILHELVLGGAVLGLCRELGLLHCAAGGRLNPWVPSAPSETSRVNKRAVFVQENPVWGELEPYLCYRRETLCNSLPNSPRVCKSTNLLSGCQPVPALPSLSPASSQGGHGARVTPSWGEQRGPPQQPHGREGSAALVREGFRPTFLSALPQPQTYKTACWNQTPA